MQAVPYAQDEIVLLVPHDHELARRGTIEKNELYNLNFVSLHQGNSSRATQERLLQEQDIQCQHLKIDMVRPASTRLRSSFVCAAISMVMCLHHPQAASGRHGHNQTAAAAQPQPVRCRAGAEFH